ncbi:MAG: glycosyltransferase family 2 protein [Bacteroidales bacterium]|nr:glycosyltransferase family 2 protein [Bacteroidales bacterium]MCF8303415.1 glycosyltransferase family 2 protein [Bacteroidales bacterium]
METKTLTILVPAYNEEATIEQILDRIIDAPLINNIQKEIIVINDGSLDNTKKVVENYIQTHPGFNIRLQNQEKNRGKGAAIHKGIELATGNYIVVQDADLEYHPNEYNILLKPMEDGVADVVYGSRFMGGNAHRILFFWHTIGNRFLTFISNMFTNLNLTDMETCYKLFKAEILKKIQFQEKRFGFEPEVTAKMSRIPGIRVYEVGISYYGRTYDEGKKIKAKDGIWALICTVRYNLFARKRFKHED